MINNVGNADRAIRFILGISIMAIGFYFGSWIGLVGLIPIFTALVKFCPAYLPFGISTCEVKQKQ